MQLRPYQADAVDAVWSHLATRETNPVVVMPTGSGKTPVIATLCADAVGRWKGRVVVLAHVKELLSQTVEKLAAFAPDLEVGVFSAGLGRRELHQPITVAGIQSIHDRARELGPVDLVVVDEAHLIPPDGEGMYRRFISETAAISRDRRVIGLTATPYRMTTGPICSPEHFLQEICIEVPIRDLIADGYLSPLRSRAGLTVADTSRIAKSRGEFASRELEDLMDDDALVSGACTEIVAATVDRRGVLIFCSGIRHGQHVVRELRERHGIECGFVSGDMPAAERDEVIARFRSGDLRYLANVQVLTIGFDAPHIDCVAMLRPTLSPGLFYQMVGRGLRTHEGKQDCLVLDFAGNILTHGPIDAIRDPRLPQGSGEAPAKECPACHALLHASLANCTECGHAFPPRRVAKHDAVAADVDVLSDGTSQPSRWTEDVSDVTYHVHRKRTDPSSLSMRISYRTGFADWVSEWKCFDHPLGSYARNQAEKWWRARSNEPCPASVEEAVDLANAGGLATARRITLEHNRKTGWPDIVGYDLGEKPPRLESENGLPEPVACSVDLLDDIPF